MTTTTVHDFAFKHPTVHLVGNDELSKAPTPDGPESFNAEDFKNQPRTMSHHLSCTKAPSRLWLKTEANFWRTLMSLGMKFHDFASPKPPKPSFVRKIPTNTVPIELYFYTPFDYTSLVASGHRFPVVVNFHGGGFCLGHATDDRYWARVVLQQTSAVFISVNYRRAPEHPFPIPVDDCVESLIYLSKHAASLGLDTTRVALSGFSSGANLAIAAPLRLKYYTLKDIVPITPISSPDTPSTSTSISPSPSNLTASTTNFLHPSPSNETATPLKIACIIAWYPLLDWTKSRAQKKRTSLNPPKCLPKVFTDLFDYSYLPPPDSDCDHCSPYASPGLAPDIYIKDGLPADIQMWMCEWDMLLMEGKMFAGRLEGLGKNVAARVIPKVPHAWDKSPNPFRDQHSIDEIYKEAVTELKEAFQAK
jgi:putative ergosteryl-3beta-O-L-aspartate hydrolase